MMASCLLLQDIWTINTQFLLSVQKLLGVQSSGKNKQPLPRDGKHMQTYGEQTILLVKEVGSIFSIRQLISIPVL